MNKLKFVILNTILLATVSSCNENSQPKGKAETKAEQVVATYSQTTDIPSGITTPNNVSTSIGELKFIDGAPLPETAKLVYENLDRMRGVDVFLKGIPAASVRQLMVGPEKLGVDAVGKILIMDKLMDSKPLFLTGNTSSLYVFPYLNTKEVGPIVIEVPSRMLGAFNDAWFRYLEDVGPFGPDKIKGGKYLLLPPGYDGKIPDGYFIVKSPSYRNWLFMRGFIDVSVEETVKHIKANLKVYPLSKADNPPKTEFISGSNKSFNTIHTNDFSFYQHVNEVIQEEPYGLIDEETRGLFASIGIIKGKKFAPDKRMKKILVDAVAIGNATARSIVWYPRVKGSVDNMKGIKSFPGTESNWIMPWVGRNIYFTGKDGHTKNSDARVMFHYPYTAVTPAMAVPRIGIGSDYRIAYLDSKGSPFDGSKTYKLHVPANPPAKDFWAVTVYDSQTRSQLQTDQKFPRLGSLSKNINMNEDGSVDVYFSPRAPKGYENNWIQTIPGKSWFTIFRVYGPLEAWHNKTWTTGEIEMIE